MSSFYSPFRLLRASTVDRSIVSVRDYGARGVEFSNDDTARFLAAVNAAPLGSQVYVPEGTYIIDNLVIARDVGLRLHPKAVLKHKANATTHMVHYSTPFTGIIEGGTFDGNKTNQTGALAVSQRVSLLYMYSNGGQVRNSIFKNYMYAAILDFQSLGDFSVNFNRFIDGYELEHDVQDSNGAVVFAPGIVGGAPHVDVSHNVFRQSAQPTTGRRAPGAIYFAASDANSSFNSVMITHNKCYRMGGRHRTVGHGRAVIDIYEDTYDCVVAYNFVDCAEHDDVLANWIPFKLQNVQNLVCEGNIARTLGSVAYLYVPGERFQTNEYRNAKFIGNTVEDSPNAIGYYVDAAAGGFHEFVIAHNTARDVQRGIYVNGLLDDAVTNEGFGPGLITGNQVWASGHNGIQIANVRGFFDIVDNYVEVTGAGALVANDGVSLSRFRLRGNTFKTLSGGSTGVRMWGAAQISFSNNIFDCAAEAIELKQDGSANLIGRLHWDNNNTVIAGTIDITVADISAGYYHHGNAFKAFPNSGAAVTWTNIAGDRILAIDQTNKTVVAGAGTLGGGYAFLATVDTAGVGNNILASNITAGGVANVAVKSDSCQGGVRAWSSTFNDAYLQDKVGLWLESNATALVLAAVGASQTVQVYAGGSTLIAEIDGTMSATESGLLLRADGSLRRVKVGAAGTGPGGSGRALYVD